MSVSKDTHDSTYPYALGALLELPAGAQVHVAYRFADGSYGPWYKVDMGAVPDAALRPRKEGE